ncbi:hypothetical protein DVH24_004594 [Malus domestica]|uniref:Uncharacterized protein n=1 Tax=Malus domestica TaxID=3750 RepID=A0A498IBU1_MALDO|nr:hypothetical protein DVH24_004594 [Malus domestica]
MASAEVFGLMRTIAKDDRLWKHIKLLGGDEPDPSLWFSGLGFVKTNGGSLLQVHKIWVGGMQALMFRW